MNKFNWESCKASCQSFWQSWRPKLMDFLEGLIRTIGSFLWSAMIAFCLASTIKDACTSSSYSIFFGSWILAWVILRVIRYFTVRNMDLFAGAVNPNSWQSAFTFILDGIISCFTLGKRLSEGGDISQPIVRIVLGVLWIWLFLTEMVIAVKRNHEKAIMAISTLEEMSTRMTDEDTKCICVKARCDDGPEKTLYWVQADHDPTEDGPIE